MAIVTVPTAETALAGIMTEVFVADGYQFGCVGVPLISTVADETKSLPVRVRLKFGAPAVTEPGDMLLSTGTGFTTWNVSALDGLFCDAASWTVMVRLHVHVRFWAGIVN